MEDEIRTEFERSGFAVEAESETLNKCLTFCINYKLSPSDLVSSWEVYYLNRQLNGSTVQDAEMDGFLLHLQNEQRDAMIKEEPNLHVYSSHDDIIRILGEEQEGVKGLPDTPSNIPSRLDQETYDSGRKTRGSVLSSGKPSDLVTPFGQRTSKFVVQFAINSQHSVNSTALNNADDLNEDDIIRKIQPIKKCSLHIHGSDPKPGCKFMYDRIEDKFNYLENRINKSALAFIASGLHEKAVDPTVASQNNIFAVGMINCDGEGRLNEKSVLLQNSAEHSGGQHVRLDLDKLSHYSIFPGQVVGIVGNNPSGHCLVPSEVVEYIPSVEHSHPAKKIALDEKSVSNGEPQKPSEVSLIIASGPFTTTDNLFFEPLTELLAYATRKQPQLLILTGPFVDSEHPEIKKETLDRSFDDIFHQEVIRRLQDHVEYMGSETRVLLVPSVRDATHDFVFPQAPFDAVLSNHKDQIASLSNPGIFYVNEVNVGCCTVDILKQLSGEEISRLPKDRSSGDRLSRLTTHLLNQSSFYPLYPPAEGVPLDLSIAPDALDIPWVPQILILPSDLAPFIKVVSVKGKDDEEVQKSCICVNPGRLAKGIGGGTFVELQYRESSENTQASIVRV